MTAKLKTYDVARLAALQGSELGRVVIKAGETPPLAHAPEEVEDPKRPRYPHVVKPLEEHQTLQDELVYLCDVLEGEYTVNSNEDDTLFTWRIHMATGDVLAGQGPTREAAFSNLKEKAVLMATSLTPEASE